MRGPGQGQADECFPEGPDRAKSKHPPHPHPQQLPPHQRPGPPVCVQRWLDQGGERHLEKYAWDGAKNSPLRRFPSAGTNEESRDGIQILFQCSRLLSPAL